MGNGEVDLTVICSGRKTSRTTRLIELCIDAEARGEPSYIVCHSRHEAIRIMRKASEMGYHIPMPITYDEFMRNQYASKFIKHFFFDNVEKFVQMLTPVHVAAITILKTDNG